VVDYVNVAFSSVILWILWICFLGRPSFCKTKEVLVANPNTIHSEAGLPLVSIFSIPSREHTALFIKPKSTVFNCFCILVITVLIS